MFAEDPKMFAASSINDFFLDEQPGNLWLSQKNVGILKCNIESKKLEIYTTEDSNIPIVDIERITKDKDGAIWASTYAGVVKQNYQC